MCFTFTNIKASTLHFDQIVNVPLTNVLINYICLSNRDIIQMQGEYCMHFNSVNVNHNHLNYHAYAYYCIITLCNLLL